MGNHSKCFKCGELDEFCVCPAAPAYALKGATVPAGASMRDMLRWSQANTDYHGLIAFTQAQFDHFVSMVQAAAKAPAAQAVDALELPYVEGWSLPRDLPTAHAVIQKLRIAYAEAVCKAENAASPASTPEASQQENK